ncbi:MAG TPA: STAS domain-containing protein [Pyrinomonadaceae bacterium]|nr:STAS domain-containing protein [Pyrinomonadaceae bacterium]
MLKVHAKRLDAVEVLSLEGQIVNGQTELLRNVGPLADDTRELILDLSNVTTVDAHGLGVLLQLREQTLAKGIHLELRNVNQPLYRIFEITRLNTVFDIDSAILVPEFVYSQRLPVAA